MRVSADQHKCVAAGVCVGIAPTVFDQRDLDGKVEVLDEHPEEDLRDAVVEAVDFCPAFAITLER